VVASFLVEHLPIDWRCGEQWFWDTRVDADPGSNPANWQWAAGSGADPHPASGCSIRSCRARSSTPTGLCPRWVPKLAALPAALIHQPWRVAPLERSGAGVAAWQDLSGTDRRSQEGAQTRARRLCHGWRGVSSHRIRFTHLRIALSLSFRQTLGDNMDDEKPVEPMMEAPSPVMEPPKAPAKKPAKARKAAKKVAKKVMPKKAKKAKKAGKKAAAKKSAKKAVKKSAKKATKKAAKKKKKAKKSKR
jgi:hypothetical protein